MNRIIFEKLDQLGYQSNEAFKTLRTNIQFCGSDLKTIMLTSSIPNEGKSSVTFDLVRSMAENNKKVIFIDTDMRKSVIHGRYRVGMKVNGLSEYLSGQTELSDTIHETNVENMHIILAGQVPPNPAELLAGQRFQELLTNLRDQYDYVIIDTPPIGCVIDAAIVAEKCDGAMIVIESGSVSYKFVKNAKEQLEKSGCKILGAVLNKIKLEDSKQYGKYYGKYYGNYYAAENG